MCNQSEMPHTRDTCFVESVQKEGIGPSLRYFHVLTMNEVVYRMFYVPVILHMGVSDNSMYMHNTDLTGVM